MQAPRPEIMCRLLPASSQEYISGGMNWVSFFMYSSAAGVPSELTVILPLSFTSSPPKDLKRGPSQELVSLVWPIGLPKGTPALCSFSA